MCLYASTVHTLDKKCFSNVHCRYPQINMTVLFYFVGSKIIMNLSVNWAEENTVKSLKQ